MAEEKVEEEDQSLRSRAQCGGPGDAAYIPELNKLNKLNSRGGSHAGNEDHTNGRAANDLEDDAGAGRGADDEYSRDRLVRMLPARTGKSRYLWRRVWVHPVDDEVWLELQLEIGFVIFVRDIAGLLALPRSAWQGATIKAP